MSGTGGTDPVDRARKAFGIFTTASGHCFKRCVRSIFSSGQPSAWLGDVMPGFSHTLLLEAPLFLWLPWGSAVGCENWAASEGSSPLGAVRWPLLRCWTLQQPRQCKTAILSTVCMGISPRTPPIPTGCTWGAVLLPTGSGRAGAAILLSNRASHKGTTLLWQLS